MHVETTTITPANGKPVTVERRQKTKRPAKGRTGRAQEARTHYRSKLFSTMRRVLPASFVREKMNRPQPSPWTPFQTKPEVLDLIDLLTAHHTASPSGSDVSKAEVVFALIEAGLPVLLKQPGWRLPE